jgi:hypothetical protein
MPCHLEPRLFHFALLAKRCKVKQALFQMRFGMDGTLLVTTVLKPKSMLSSSQFIEHHHMECIFASIKKKSINV